MNENNTVTETKEEFEARMRAQNALRVKSHIKAGVASARRRTIRGY